MNVSQLTGAHWFPAMKNEQQRSYPWLVLPVMAVGAAAGLFIVNGWRFPSFLKHEPQERPSTIKLTEGSPANDLKTLLLLSQPGFPEESAARLYAVLHRVDGATLKARMLELDRANPRDEAWRQLREVLLECRLERDAHEALADIRPESGAERSLLVTEALDSVRDLPPDEARRQLLAIRDFSVREKALCDFAAALGARDPQAAMDFFKGLENGQHRKAAGMALAAAWAKNDFSAAAQWARGLKPPSLLAEAAHEMIRMAAARDPAAAGALFLAMPPDAQTPWYVAKILGLWLKADPAAAVDWTAALPGKQTREFAYQSLAESLGKTDPEQAAAFVENLPVGKARRDFIQSLAEQWSGQDADAAGKWALQLPDADQSSAMRKVVEGLARSRPAAEVEAFLASLGNSPLVVDAARGAAVGMGGRKGFDWAAQVLPETEDRLPVQMEILKNWSFLGDFTALEAAFTLPQSPERDRLIAHGILQTANNNPEKVIHWAETLPANDRILAFQNVAQQATWNHPEEAAKAVDALRAMPGVTTEQIQPVLSEAARAWAAVEGSQAAAWALSLPPDLQKEAVGAVSFGWGRADFDGAAAWVRQLPEGPVRDQAIRTMADSPPENRKGEMVQMSTLVQDGDTAWNVFASHFGDLAKQDAAAARNALENSRLTPAQKESLQHYFKP